MNAQVNVSAVRSVESKARLNAVNGVKFCTGVAEAIQLLLADTKDFSVKSLAAVVRNKVRGLTSSDEAIVSMIETVGSDEEKQVAVAEAIVKAKEILVSKATIDASRYDLSCTSNGIRINAVTKGGVLQFGDSSIKSKRGYVSYLRFTDMNRKYYNMLMKRIVVIRSWKDKKTEEVMVEELNYDSFVTKHAMVSASGVVLDTLREKPNAVLVLRYNFSNGKLEPIESPMTFDDKLTKIIFKKYGKYPGMNAPSKAQEGYIEFNIDYKGFMETADNINFLCTESAKKAVARQEKLNSEKEIVFTVQDRVFLIKDVIDEGLYGLNQFNTGCYYASTNTFLKIGVCRITSDVNNALIKGATHMARLIAFDGQSVSYAAASSYKSKLRGLLLAKGYNVSLADVSNLPVLETERRTLLDGTIVEGVEVTVNLNITNAYSVEMYRKAAVGEVEYDTLEEAFAAIDEEQLNKSLKFNKKEVFNISKEVFSKLDTELLPVIKQLRKDRKILRKLPMTTVTSSEFENTSMSFGDNVSVDWMHSLLNNGLNRVTTKIKRAAEYASGKFENVVEVPLHDALLAYYQASKANGMNPGEGYNFYTCSKAFLVNLLQGLQLVGEYDWVHIKGQVGDVYIPANIYSTVVRASDTDLEVELPAVLKEVLTRLDFLYNPWVQGKGVIECKELETSWLDSMQFAVQHKLINKATTKLKAVGKYFTLLPGYWLENKYDVCMPNRDFYVKSDEDWVEANVCKHPAIFEEAIAGCRVTKNLPLEIENFSIYERELLGCVIFVHPDYLLELQNDCDGDLARITFDSYVLPKYQGNVLNGVMSEFHKQYVEGENDIIVGNTIKVQSFNLRSVYAGIKEAIDSKKNVAKFTTNLHKLQNHIRTSTYCVLNNITVDQKRAMLAVVGSMIQTDAMNAIKHDGSVLAGAVLTSTVLTEEVKHTAVEALVKYFEEHNVKVEEPEQFAVHLVEVMLECHEAGAQYERLMFKDMPTVGKTLLDFKGMFAEEWNVTGSDSMFSYYLEAFFSRCFSEEESN